MPFLAPLVGLIGTALAGGTITAFSAIFAGVSVGLGFVQSNKKQKQPERQAQVAQMSLGEGPREAIFGKAMTGGRLMQVWNDGTKNEFETLVIKLADHECNDYEGFLIGEDYYGAEANGAHSSFTVGGTPHLYIYFQSGAAGQTVPSAITSVSGSEWPSTAKMVGCAHVIVRYKFNEKVWPGGRPQFKWYMGGLKCYDPRKDSTVAGGSGSHRWDDQSTYEYTQNPILLAYNYRRGVWNNGELMVGRGLSAYRCPPEAVIADANICDELVPQLSGPDLVRYDCGRVVRADEPFIDVMTSFAEACGGMLVQRSGRLEIAAGAPQSSVFSFTDDDLVPGEPRDFLGWLKEDERCNTVVPRYLEPTQFWNSTSAPIRRDNADVTADGRPFEKIIELDSVFVNSQAQRLAEIERRKARLERTAAVTLPPRACNVEAGDVVTLTSNRYLGGDAVKWWVMRDDDMPSCRKRLTLREYDDSIFDWTAASDEIAPGEIAPATTPPGALTLASPDVSAVRVSGVPVLQFTWTGTTDPAINRIVVEVRVAGDTETATTIIADPSVGLENIFNGIVPATAMELRARPDSDDKSRETTWTSWIAETTLTADYSGGGFLLGSASDIESTPAGGLSATNVQAALNELDSEKQPLDGDLTAIAALTTTSFGRSLLTETNAGSLRTTAGLVIGTDVQAYSANLAAFAGLSLVADRLPYANGTGTLALATFTAFGRSLIDDADALAARTTLGLEAGWQTYTPTVTSGTGTITSQLYAACRYEQRGKTVTANFFVYIVTNGTAGQSIDFTLPVAAYSSMNSIGTGRGAGGEMLQAVVGASTLVCVDTDNLYPGADATAIYASVTYEAA